MKEKEMLWRNYASWERSFRKAARADKFAVFKEYLDRLREDEDYWHYYTADKSFSDYFEIGHLHWGEEVPGTPKSMLESTISAVQAVVGYASINQAEWVSEAISEFLAMQEYDPAKLNGSYYMLTFDLGNSLARPFVDVVSMCNASHGTRDAFAS